MSEPILKVENLHADYDGVPVVFGVSLEVMPGELVAIVGANGAGKTTTMRAIARGLMSRPRLLMLDEMSLGLMPSMAEKMMETVTAINRGGATVLLVEQMVQETLEIAHRGYVIQNGRIVQSGAARDLLDSETVRKAYLGM